MYEYLDRPITTLDPASRFLLWAVRAAASALGERRCMGAALGPGFACIGLDEALPHFAIGMAVLVREASQPIHIAKPNCCCVAEHEALLLTLLTAADMGDDARVQATAALLVEGEQSAATLARALRAVTAEVLAHGLMPARPYGANNE